MNRKRYNFKAGGLKPVSPTCAFGIERPDTFPVPAYIDSRPYCLPPSNQGQTSDCAGYSIAGIIEVHNWQTHDKYEQIDGTTIAKKGRELSGVTDQNEGITLDAAVSAAQMLGLLPATTLWKVRNLQDIQYALHRNVVCLCGFDIDANWNYVDIETGRIGNKAGLPSIGGHAVVVCGYNSIHRTITWQNSWGEVWGNNGFGMMTFDQFEGQFMYGIALELKT